MKQFIGNVCSFFKMKYQQWLMRRVDKDLKWYVDDYVIRNDNLEMTLIDADNRIEELASRLEVYEPSPEWEEEESVEKAWDDLYNLMEEMRWGSLERLLEP